MFRNMINNAWTNKIFKIFDFKRKHIAAKTNRKTIMQQENRSQKLAKRYCLSAILFFGLQSIIALGGAMELIFPDLPAPIGFQHGRAIHLNLSILWPTLGLMGMTYYFFVSESEVEIYSLRLAKVQFWIFVVSILGILGSLVLGINDGREYLEGKLPFRILILLALVIFAYNLLRTYLLPESKKRATSVIMVTGVISAIVLLTPNLLFFSHQTVDDYVKFWVVHMWEELSFELVGAGITIALLMAITNVKRLALEKLLYLEASMIVSTGLLATGHHYYWIGVPKFWLIIGLLFSTFQVIPIILVFYSLLKNLKVKGRLINNYVVLGLIVVSSFWHVTGAGLLGLLMSIPSLNLYMHGTLITSSHSHLALFGVFGMLVIAGSYYILTNSVTLSRKFQIKTILSFVLINSGLLVMGGALFLAGLIQMYLWRIAGMDFIEVQILLKPYYLIRGLGGMLFTGGSLLFTWKIINLIIKRKIQLL